MLDALFHQPLVLHVGRRVLRFHRLPDFEFALAPRTEVPAEKVHELLQMAPEALLREAGAIRELEKDLVGRVARSIEERGSIGHLLRQIDPKLFSQDHDWRPIMAALAGQPSRYDEFKRLALVKYVQYLGARQDALESLYASRTRSGSAAARVGPAGRGSPELDGARETLRLDLEGDPPARSQKAGRFDRLPRGEAVALNLGASDVLELILSRHRCLLRGGEPVCLVDTGGLEHRLAEGRNVIGRMPDNDVVIDAACRDVSRRHLVVEVLYDERVELTDLSSHGTFLARGRVEALEGA